MERPLVICIGNTARGDDGVAHLVAALLHDMPGLCARIEDAVDLDISMVTDIAEAQELIIVDAQRREAPLVSVTIMAPEPSGAPSGHGIDGPTLLALCGRLYDRIPETRLVSVAAPFMEHTTELSETAKAAAGEAAASIAGMLGAS